MKYTLKVGVRGADSPEIFVNSLEAARGYIESYGSDALYGLVIHTKTNEIVACYNYDALTGRHFKADYLIEGGD